MQTQRNYFVIYAKLVQSSKTNLIKMQSTKYFWYHQIVERFRMVERKIFKLET